MKRIVWGAGREARRGANLDAIHQFCSCEACGERDSGCKIVQIACYLATAVFCVFSYLQLNDLDQYGTQLWYGWVLVYAATALVALISALRVLPRPLYIGSAGCALLAAAIRSTSIDWDAGILYNEANPAGNETFGLLIVGLWFTFLALRRLASQPAATSSAQQQA